MIIAASCVSASSDEIHPEAGHRAWCDARHFYSVLLDVAVEDLVCALETLIMVREHFDVQADQLR